MNVLVYKRKKDRNVYYNVAKKISTDKVITVSEFRGLGEVWVGEFLYKESIIVEEFNYKKEFNACKEEVIKRCRFLRSLNEEIAERLLMKVWIGFDRLYRERNIGLIFQPLIDNYTLDVMSRLAELHGIEVVSFVGHFFHGYFRISVRGEYNKIRSEIEFDEIKKVMNIVLKDDFKPTFDLMKKKSSLELIKRNIRRKIIEGVYYPIMKFIEGDPFNYHYNTIILKNGFLERVSSKRFQYFDPIERVKTEKRKIVYWPLHMIPEATTDYWCQDLRDVDYEESILDVIANSSKEVCFLIKEHPSMEGWRDVDFYKKLKKNENVILLRSEVSSNWALNESSYVLVHTGSVGVEALLRGKVVFTLTDNYYSRFHKNCVKARYITKDLLEFVDSNLVNECDNEDENIHFVESILMGLYPGCWNPIVPEKTTQGQLLEASYKFIRRK